MWRARQFFPRLGYGLMVVGLVLQVWVHGRSSPVPARLEPWPEPVSTHWLRVFSLGEPVVLAKGMLLWLQTFSYQAGVAVTLSDLDMGRLEGWLGNLLDLDPRSQYPLLMAVRYYGEFSPPDQQRRLLGFVYRRFFEDPHSRWPWLAHGAIVARHRLQDLPLALAYARAIRRHATGAQVPSWAKQMEIVLLEDLGEWQEVRYQIEALLASGALQDAREIHFWTDRLRQLRESAHTAP